MTIKQVQDRLRDIVTGLGIDGSLGAAAQARAIPVEHFRPTENPDPSTNDAPALDRAVNVSLGALAERVPRNVYCNEVQWTATLELRVSYAAAPAQWQLVHDEADEAAKREASADWAVRAMDDVRTLDRALTWFEFWAGVAPTIEQVLPRGEAITTDLGNGRGLLTRRYDVWMEDTE